MSGVLYLHVGPPKTATSYLQRVVLPHTQSLHYHIKPTVPIGEIDMRFGDLFLFSPAVWRSDLGRKALSFLTREVSSGQSLLISSEYIYGGFASPQPLLSNAERKYGPIVRTGRHLNARPDSSSFAQHLSVLREAVQAQRSFSEVKILMTARRQDTNLASAYAQASHLVRGASQKHFERWAHHLTRNAIGFHLGGGQKLDYYSWWDEMVEVLGPSNVLLLPFERLTDDKPGFLRPWLEFLDVEDTDRILDSTADSEKENARSTSRHSWKISPPARTGPTLRPTRLFRRLGLPTSLPSRWPDFSREKSIDLTPDLSRELLAPYTEGNQSLDAAVPDLRLKEYDYYERHPESWTVEKSEVGSQPA